LGPYRIIGRLGAGGMGVAYAATGPAGERVAVKAIHPHQAQDADFRARFHREVQTLRRVNGPCLVPLLAADTTAALPWLATSYVPGPTLQEHVTARGPVDSAQLHVLAAGTAAALVSIHAAGVVHRDLKPANIILAPPGPRVLDFGIAHTADGTAVTRTGVMTGTPGWISPELYRDGASGAAGDVFCWGALIAYAATGRPPFGTGAPDAIAFRVMQGEPDLAGVPDELLGVLESALSKDPARRPPAHVLAERTGKLLAAQATQVLGVGADPAAAVTALITQQWHVPTTADPAWDTAAARRRRGRTMLISAAALAAFAAGGTATWFALNLAGPPVHRTVAHAARSTTSPPTSPSTPAPSAQPAKATPAPSSAPAGTQVIKVAPWTPEGQPASGITVTGDVTGKCYSQSETTFRPDAWRCTTGNQLLDPCFSSSYLEAAGGQLLCLGSPAMDHMVRLNLDEALPQSNDHVQGELPPLKIVLADGQSCLFASGATKTLSGQRLNYSCDHGVLYGGPDRTNATWTITYMGNGSETAKLADIAAVYL
jgi:serine/threonine protein kinase